VYRSPGRDSRAGCGQGPHRSHLSSNGTSIHALRDPSWRAPAQRRNHRLWHPLSSFSADRIPTRWSLGFPQHGGLADTEPATSRPTCEFTRKEDVAAAMIIRASARADARLQTSGGWFEMIRAQANAGEGVVHLWASDLAVVSNSALCGATGPAVPDQAGRRCAVCWQAHGDLLTSAFTRSTQRHAA
jgi:hypothetical protein